MIQVTRLENSVLFEFSENQHYLYNGSIEVPYNTLSIIQDGSDMITLRKSASNDIFLSARYNDFGEGSVDAAVDMLADSLFNAEGGGGDISSGEVQTMIDNSLEDYYTDDEVDVALSGKASVSDVTALQNEVATKADTSAVTAVANDVQTVSGQVATKVDESEFSTHTANTDIHVSSQEKNDWNNKLDADDLAPYWTSAETQNAIDAATSGIPSSQTIEALRTDVNTISGDVADINDAIAELDDKEQVIASALTQLRDDMDEKEEVIASALTELNEAIGDPYQKVSGLTIDTNKEDFSFIRIEAELEGGDSAYTFINDAGLESTYENNAEGSNYSSFVGQGSFNNSATDFPDDNVTSERSLNVTTDGFNQTTYENYDDGESKYTRYSSENEFNYSSGLQLHQYWYDEKSDTETNSYINITNDKEGATFIELTDTNERTVSITPNMLSWDDGKDSGGFEWSNVATLNDIPEYSAGTGIDITDNVISVTGGTGSGMTSGEVQTMINDALDDYYDKDEVDAALSGKADTSALTAVNDALTAHTSNGGIHVTSQEKDAWNSKQDTLSAGTGINISGNVISVTGGGGGGNNVIEVTQAQYDALESAGTLDLTALYVITDASPVSITVDPSLNSGSTNPVANSAITSAINTVNDALGGLKLVKLTQNEYDQLATKDPDTLYIISNVVS